MNYLELYALKVEQPLCEFYITALKVKNIREFSFSEELQYINDSGKLAGSQRKIDDKRLKEIGKYIDSVEMSFPNSIILAANYNQKGEIINDDTIRWQVEPVEKNLYKIKIPTNNKLAAVIDGQHRLRGFDSKFISNSTRIDLELPCAIFFDLPNSYQAFLFATINGNQKRVDKSLALEQFGFNVEDEPQASWTPEKLSVYFSRKLNFKDSPLKGHIKIAPKISSNLLSQISPPETEWVVSTATIVDGILSLISNKPKRDRVEMAQENIWGKRSRKMVEQFKNDNSPLRKLYIDGEDDLIFDIINKFLTAVNQTLWKNYNSKSYIFKTVGVLALFDILKSILIANPENHINIDFFEILQKASKIDFSDKFFQASGIGRSRIKNTIGLVTNLIQKEKLKKNDVPFYESVINGEGTKIDKDKWVWDDEAENSVLHLLENAEWNYKQKSVFLFVDNNYDSPSEFTKYELFFKKLVEIAEINFAAHLPSDNEFADEQKEKFDAEDMVNSCLQNYTSNLKELAWIK